MPTKRTRVTRNLIPEISDEELCFLSDAMLGIRPEKMGLKMYVLKGDQKARKALWDTHKDEILAEWIRQRPGSRPSMWWEFSAPRIAQESMNALGRGKTVVQLHPENFCEPRLRLGGIGTPDFQELNYWPIFVCAIPAGWVSAWQTSYYNGKARDIHGNPIGTEYVEGNFLGVPPDPRDPPVYESQAAYLRVARTIDARGKAAPAEECLRARNNPTRNGRRNRRRQVAGGINGHYTLIPYLQNVCIYEYTR